LEKNRIVISEINEMKWKGSGVLNGGNFILMYSGNESNTFGTGFMINRKYKQAIMNLETVDDGMWCLGLRGEFNNITIISLPAAAEEKDELVRTAFTMS
jgi:hypothetical protein